MNRRITVAAVVAWHLLAAAPAWGLETLDQAWSLALGTNAQLAAVELEATAAQEDVGASTAQRLPVGWVQSSYSVHSDERSFRIANPLSPGDTFVAPYAQREGLGAAAGITMPLYAGGAIENSILSAEARQAAATHAAAASRLQLLLAVSEAYVAVLRSQQELQVAEQNLVSLKAHETEVARHFAQQRVPRSEVLATQVATARAEQLRLRREHQLASTRGEYNRLLGRPLVAPVGLAEITLPPLRYGLEELQSIAARQRPELAQLWASRDARMFEADRLRAAARPHVDAVGSHDYDENRFQTPQGISTAAVVLEWSPYDGGKSRRAAAAEQARASSIGKLIEDLNSRIALEVLMQWNSVHENEARLEVASQAQGHAEENLRVSQFRYVQGMAVSSEVLDAQSERTQAASDQQNTGYDLCLAQLRLRYAAGILGSGE